VRILIIEDEAALRDQIAARLTREGFHCEVTGDGAEGLYLASEYPFDAALVDLGLPGTPGLEVIRKLRAAGNLLPILVVTARGRWQEKVEGLEAGADDYLAKPFELSELEARLRALYRRRLNTAHSVLAVGALGFDTVSRRFTVGGQPLELPPREHDLLEALMINAGRPVNKLLLADRLRSSDSVLSHDALEVYVHRLRRRIEGSGAAIHTLRGLGYLLEAADASPA